MGNDGGTIVKRMHYVRTKDDGSKSSVSPAIKSRLQATTCALSHEPLRSPVVSDRLGRLYNKESIVNLLLRRAEGKTVDGDGEQDHIRTLKDIKTLTLQPNSAFDPEHDFDVDARAPAPFLCPLTQREMDGRYRFVYLIGCGCVMSENGLRNTVAEQQGQYSMEGHARCPVCSQECTLQFSGKRLVLPGADVIILNGTAEEIEQMRAMMLDSRAAEKAKRKTAKNAKRDGDEKTGKRKRERHDGSAIEGSKKSKDAEKIDGQRHTITVT